MRSSQYLGSRWNGSAELNTYALLRNDATVCVLVNNVPIYCLPPRTQTALLGPWIFPSTSAAGNVRRILLVYMCARFHCVFIFTYLVFIFFRFTNHGLIFSLSFL